MTAKIAGWPFLITVAALLFAGCAKSDDADKQTSSNAITPSAASGVTTLVMNLGDGKSIYVVVDLTNAQTAAIVQQMTQAAQAAANQAAASGAGVLSEQATAAAAAMNTARSFATITDNQIRIASIVVDAAGNEVTNAGLMAAQGTGYCVEMSALTMSTLERVSLSNGAHAADGFVMMGVRATDIAGEELSHVVLGNLAADLVVDPLVPTTGTTGVYSFALGDTLYPSIKVGGAFQPGTLPPSLSRVLVDPSLPPATPTQIVAEASASDLVSVSSTAAKFLANPAVQVGLKALGVVGTAAYVYQGLQYSENLYAQTATNIAAVLGPFWNYKFPSPAHASAPPSVPYYPGLTQYLLSNGIDPTTMLSDPGGTMWFRNARGQIISATILSSGSYRISEPSGIVVNLNQSGDVVYDLGVRFSVTGTGCGDPDAIMNADGQCVPNPHACDPLASETTCSIPEGVGAENGGFCDPLSDDACSGGAGAVFGTTLGSWGLGCDPFSDPTCPPGGDFCDPYAQPGCSGLEGESSSGPPPPPAIGSPSPVMHKPWVDMRIGDVGIPPQASTPFPRSDFWTYRSHPNSHFYDYPFEWDYQGEANGRRYFTLYPRGVDVSPLRAFTTTESVGILRADGSFNFGFAACAYDSGVLTGDYYTVPLRVESFDPNVLKVSVPSNAPPDCNIVVSQNHNDFNFKVAWGWTDNILTGPALAMTALGQDAEIPLSWKSRGVKQAQIHMGSPTGPVVASGGASGNVTVGGVKDATAFYLVDASTGAMLVSYTARLLQLPPKETSCGECAVLQGTSCAPAENGKWCANDTMTCHSGVCREAFDDVPAGSKYHDFLVDMLRRGITSGCSYDPATGSRLYCPDASHTRAEAAVFIVRARNLAKPDAGHGLLGGSVNNFQCKTSSGGYDDCHAAAVPQYFDDVPPSHWAYAWIEKLAELGITHGCGTRAYCPDATLELYDTTAFVERGAYGCTSDFNCDGAIDFPSTPIYFSDMTDRTNVWFRFMQSSGAHGRWCGKADGSGFPYGRYGLNDTITRRQAASLIERTFFGGAACTTPEW